MDAAQMPERQGPDEQIALPRRKLVAAIHRKSRGRNRRRPTDPRPPEAGTLRVGRNIGPRIVHAVGDHRPTVVPARYYDVQLVAAARTMLRFVQPCALRIVDQSLRVAMTPGIDLRTDGRAADERVISR